jgi:Zn-dependent protease
MFKSWRLGRVLGFPVEINLSFLLLLAVVLVAYGGLAGVFVVCLAFGSVLLHELGHALVARRLGVHVSGIELSFFGGAAKMVELPRVPNQELAIAAAGPAVSLVLGGAGLGLGALFGSSFLGLVGWINLVIAGFNLLPALPMDGGRILRALLAPRLGFVRATDVAVTVARVVAIGFAIVGLLGAYQLLLLAPFLWMMGTREAQLARAVPHHERVRSGAGWGSPFAPAGGGWTSPHDPFGRRGPAPIKRYAIRHVNGRVVIEALD